MVVRGPLSVQLGRLITGVGGAIALGNGATARCDAIRWRSKYVPWALVGMCVAKLSFSQLGLLS